MLQTFLYLEVWPRQAPWPFPVPAACATLFKSLVQVSLVFCLPVILPEQVDLFNFSVRLKKSFKNLVSLHISFKYTPLPTRLIFLLNPDSLNTKSQQSAMIISSAFRNTFKMLASLSFSSKCGRTLHLCRSRAQNLWLLLPVLPTCCNKCHQATKKKPSFILQ